MCHLTLDMLWGLLVRGLWVRPVLRGQTTTTASSGWKPLSVPSSQKRRFKHRYYSASSVGGWTIFCHADLIGFWFSLRPSFSAEPQASCRMESNFQLLAAHLFDSFLITQVASGPSLSPAYQVALLGFFRTRRLNLLRFLFLSCTTPIQPQHTRLIFIGNTIALCPQKQYWNATNKICH